MGSSGYGFMTYAIAVHRCYLANGVPLKQIQDWLGHSDFAITANIYAHLDFSAKHATAGAMSWLDETSLAGLVTE
jgi:integrase